MIQISLTELRRNSAAKSDCKRTVLHTARFWPFGSRQSNDKMIIANVVTRATTLIVAIIAFLDGAVSLTARTC